MADLNLSKLPKWAQRHIERLERKIESRDELIASLQPKTSRLTNGYERRVFLPDLPGGVSFNFEEPGGPRYIQVSYHDKASPRGVGLHVSGSDCLRFSPIASNVFDLELRTR